MTPSSTATELIQDGWFAEKETMWPGQKMCLKVESILENGRSDFQDVLVFKSSNYGNVLVLDGVIQVTERDEFAYQEMIAHLPLFAHPDPKKVLIVGGGDGGVLREVARHPGVSEIHMCEIDSQVCEVSLKHLPELSSKFDDPRLKLMFGDAAEYLKKEGKGADYDVIICDSSDPVGPADVLFQPEFFLSMKEALSSTGILCTQGECLYLHLDLIKTVLNNTKEIFSGNARYAYTTIPTYPSGQIGFILACNGDNDLSVAKREVHGQMEEELKYYSNDIHRASFVLPGTCVYIFIYHLLSIIPIPCIFT